MNTPKCNLTSCTLRESCQRFDEAGTISPILPFMPEGATPPPGEVYTGPLNGCVDFWPVGTESEWFETETHKTPVPDEK